MRFELHWRSETATHRDCLVASNLNLQRDLFPPALGNQIMDKPVGHHATRSFAPGELLPAWRADREIRLRSDQFDRRFSGRGFTQPRAGRFYPLGILRGVEGVCKEYWHPFRVLELSGERLLVDLNHPLARKDLLLDVIIEDVRAHGAEPGGSCNEISEMVCGGGPGMQARWQTLETDFWSDLPLLRQDPRPDSEFYGEPRFVDHLDRAALGQVSALYRRLIPRGSRILDLMSSWHSHLPEDLEPSQVVGLGMNRDELAANPALGKLLVHDLNLQPDLPFNADAFDAVVCTVSVEYLTRPFDVFREVARVLRPGGLFITSFSNRWFPPKAIRVWERIHEFERPGLVSEYFLESGLFGDLQTWSIRGLPRPGDDKYTDRLTVSDPVYAVWAKKT
jgi:SAM-dependent methyltransferase